MTEDKGASSPSSSVLVKLREQSTGIHASGSLNLEQLIPVHTSLCNVFVQKPLDVSSAGSIEPGSSGLEVVISLLPEEDHDACLGLLSSDKDSDNLLVIQYMIHGLDPTEALGSVILPYLLHAKKISVELVNSLLDIVDFSTVAKEDASSNIKKLEILKTCAESEDSLAGRVLVRMFQMAPEDPLLVEALYSKLDQVIRAANGKVDNQEMVTSLSKDILPSLTGPVNGKLVSTEVHLPKIGLLWQTAFSLYNESASEDERCRSLLLVTAILCPLLPCVMKIELPTVDAKMQVLEGTKVPADQPALWHLIFTCLSKGKSMLHKQRSEYALLRKRSLYLLDFLAPEGSWKKYCMCFETMEMETETHLIDQIWETVAELMAEAAKAGNDASNSTLTWEWMSLLLARGMSSDEPAMRKLVLYRLLKGRAGINVPYIEKAVADASQESSSKKKKKTKEPPKELGTDMETVTPDFILEVFVPSWDSLCSSIGYTMHMENERKIIKDPMTPYMIKFLEAHRTSLEKSNEDGRKLFWEKFWDSGMISKLNTKTIVLFFRTMANEDVGDYEVPASDSMLRSLTASLRGLFLERSVVRKFKEDILSSLAIMLAHSKESQTQWTPVTVLQLFSLFAPEHFDIESAEWKPQNDPLFCSLQRFVQRLRVDGVSLGSSVASAYVRGDLIPTSSSWDPIVGTSSEEREFAWSIALLCSLTGNGPTVDIAKTTGELLWPAIHGGLSHSTAAAMKGNANADKVERAILLLESGCKLRQISGLGNGDLVADRSGENVLPPPPNIEDQLLKAIDFLMYHIKTVVAIGDVTESGMIRTTGARRTMTSFAHLISQVQVLHRSFPSSLSISQAAGKLLSSSIDSLKQEGIEDELKLQSFVLVFATLSSGAEPVEDSLISVSELLLKQELSNKKGVSKTWKQAARSIIQYARWGSISCIIPALIEKCTDNNRAEMKTFFEELFESAFDAVEATPAEALVPLFNCIVLTARKWFSLTEEDFEIKTLQRIIKALLALLQDCSRSNESMYMLNEMCSLLFDPQLLLREYHMFKKDPKGPAPIRGAFRTLVKMAGAQKPHIIKTVLSWITVGWLGPDMNEPTNCGVGAIPFHEDIIKLLMFKETKIDEGSTNQSRIQRVEGSLNIPTETDDHSITRAFVLVFLSRLPDADKGLSYEVQTELLEPVILGLLKETAVQSGKKSQIMKGTPLYCLKMRGWQACCVLSRFISSKIAKKACNAAYKALEEFLHGEVRYFVEIFIIRCGMLYPEIFGGSFCSEIRKTDLSLHHVASLMVIGGNWIVGRYKIDYFAVQSDETNLRLRKVIAGVIPWLSSTQGFSRAIAQMMVHSLIPLVLDVTQKSENGDSDWYLRQHFKFLDENREMIRLRKKQSAFFEQYEVESICTPEGVLSVPVDEGNEASPVNMVEIIKKTLVEVYEEAHDEDTPAWKQAETLIGMAADIDRTIGDSDEDDTPSLNFQRKIIPLDSLNLAMDDVRSRKLLNASGRKRQDLIVCASLVDKAPNLAGLARTSEIFAADKLIVPDLNVTKMDNFKSISVGANEWIQMEECKEADLLPWLLEKKRTGHFIVALEQTSSSVSLPKLKFPSDQPIVLLLGKEKEGIPVPLLQAVDQCVEIPQMGIIRSLNVHVSGAICIWEITKQRTLDGTKSA